MMDLQAIIKRMREHVLLYIIISCALSAVSHAFPCPCSDSSLCQPVAVGSRKEVLGFSMDQTAWTQLNWSVVTTVAWNMNTSLLCKAHQHNVRVVMQASFNSSILESSAAMKAWAQEQANYAVSHFLDGINFDYEGPMTLNSSLASSYAQLVTITADTFRAAIPPAQISVDVAWGPFGIDGRFYDWSQLAAAADFLFVMAYDTRSQIYGPCLASANSPISVAQLGIQQFMDIGISEDKLVLGMPWYGYIYPCEPGTAPDQQYCPIARVPFRGAPCSDAAGHEMCWSGIQQMLANTSITRTEVRRDDLLVSPWFNIHSSEGSVTQVWFDDAESLAPKFQLANQFNLRGVGVWNFDCLFLANPSEQQQKAQNDMWAAIDVFAN